MHLESVSTLSTVFQPDNHNDETTALSRPKHLSGIPIGLMDYYADCEPESGNPTILAVSIATAFKNVEAGSNVSMSLRWQPPNVKWPSVASLPRVSLLGHLERIPEAVVQKSQIKECFVDIHHDARWWIPGSEIHDSYWARLIVDQIYWVGGFGDRAYIGWIPADLWRSVTIDEIADARLPHETR